MTRAFVPPLRRRVPQRLTQRDAPPRLSPAVAGPSRGSAVNAPAMRSTAQTGWTPAAVGLIAVVVLLIATGLVFVASASSIHSLTIYQDPWYVFRRQLQWIAMGLAAGLGAVFFPYAAWRRLATPMFAVSVLATLVTLTPLGLSRGGSRRWVGPESIAVQPTELLKLSLVFVLASFVCARSHHLADPDSATHYFLRPFLVISGIAIVPVLLQPDMGTGMILVLICATMAVASGLAGRTLLRLGAVGAVLVFLFAKVSPYRWDRVVAFLKPGSDLQGIGYHVYQSKLGFASGGLVGRGIGASRAKWGFLPNAHTDFIFAIIGEETGLIGSLLILGLYGALIFVGMHVARRARDRFASLVAAAITTWIATQAVINTGAVLGSMPVTGVPLPFVSVGGSSFVVLMVATGALINIARTGMFDATTDLATRSASGPARRDVGARRASEPNAVAPKGARRSAPRQRR